MKESNSRKFLLLWFGEFISAIGGGLTSFGLGVYVFQMTGSAGKMAVITLIGFLPTLLLSVPAGVLADRYDRRMLMMLGDGCSAMGIIYILFCMIRGGADFMQICIGTLISASFSALLEPSYRATVSDLLTKEEFSKAGGLVSLAGSARYLVSPILAGLLLSVSDIKLLLIIDICTFFLTVATTFVVKKGIGTKKAEHRESLMKSMFEGWNAIYSNKGVFLLIMVSSLLTLFVGVFQILAEPMILSFADPGTLGVAETVCAGGMLVSGLYLGIRGIKRNYVRILGGSLAVAGGFILGFGIWENIIAMSLFGFGFFMMLPFANNCLDYLVRTNIVEELQGRVWGFIGFLSQIGYVIAYGLSGFLADIIAKNAGISVGRGAAMLVMGAGIALIAVSVFTVFVKDIRALEK